jgi:hypothetical protein
MSNAVAHAIHSLCFQDSQFVDEESAKREEPLDAFTMTYFSDRSSESFTGQFGVNRFCKADALMRHVHLSVDGKRFVRERIFITQSALLLDVGGTQVVILPDTLCDIGPGVPHTWRGLPAGMLLPDGSRHSGESVMVFFYQEEVRGFEQVYMPNLINDPADVDRVRGEYAFPKVTQDDVMSLPYIKRGELQYGA